MPAYRRRIPFLFIALCVVILDLASKLVVYHTMTLGQGPIPILGDTLRLTYVHNPGAAFSLFRGSRWFFVTVSSLSIVAVWFLAMGERHRGRLAQIAFGLILGGALGNLIDRLWLGVVIDFIEMGLGRHRWPVYNVADAGVTVGVVLLGISLLREARSPDCGEPEAGAATHPPKGGMEEAGGNGNTG